MRIVPAASLLFSAVLTAAAAIPGPVRVTGGLVSGTPAADPKMRSRLSAICGPVLADMLKNIMAQTKDYPAGVLAWFQGQCPNQGLPEICLALGHRVSLKLPPNDQAPRLWRRKLSSRRRFIGERNGQRSMAASSLASAGPDG